jgi:hypothetical protein
MDIETSYHVGIAMTAIAMCLAILTAIIYTWVCTKTRPLKLPTVALTILLWVFLFEVAWRLYVVTRMSSSTYSYPMLGFLMCMISIGYTLFLVGTFKDSVLIHE